jgi:hypothetical protein
MPSIQFILIWIQSLKILNIIKLDFKYIWNQTTYIIFKPIFT